MNYRKYCELNIMLTHHYTFDINNDLCGAVAQLGERLTGSQEVDSSILFSSTIF
jgi:hypothetical protein